MLLDLYLGRRSSLDSDPPGQPGFIEYKFPEEECLKLYVTGPCDSCRFYDDDRYWFGVRCCGNKDSAYYKRVCGDGCIHFEQKDRRVSQYDEAEKALPDDVEADRRRVPYNYDQEEAK